MSLRLNAHIKPLYNKMIEFVKNHYMIIVWAASIIIIYAYAYLDYIYYKNNLKEKIENFYNALTEEE